MTGTSTRDVRTSTRDVRRTVGRYEILREIGRGGMATVYLSRQIDLERQVALKELGALRASDPSFVRRFLREAQLAGSLSHPNIVTVHDYFEYDGVPYLAMEYIERGSLRPYVGGMSLAQIGGVLRDVLAGLGHAEKHQIVHRDMKPENLMVSSEGSVKIADFGIAKATGKFETGAFMTSTGIAIGTPNYISPEQARAQEVGPWTDLYAVGVMTFEFFAGGPPFEDTEEPLAVLLRHVNEKVPALSEVDPAVDPRISRWVEWLVSKKPGDRPQSAGEAWEALEEALISLLGAQWAREARLLEPGERPSVAPVTPTGPPTVLIAGEDFSERATDRLDDPPMAGTLAPTPRTPAVDPQGEKPPAKLRWRRWVIGTVAAVAMVATIAAAASRPAGQGGASQPATETAATTGASGQSGAIRSLQNAQQPSAAVTKRTLATQSKTALTLARNYENTASRIERLGSRSSANTGLVAALRQTGSAYRAAGTAAAAGDSAGYTAAIASAVDGRNAVQSALGTSSGTAAPSGAATGSSPSSSSSSCAGDSSSDDPSDDEC